MCEWQKEFLEYVKLPGFIFSDVSQCDKDLNIVLAKVLMMFSKLKDKSSMRSPLCRYKDFISFFFWKDSVITQAKAWKPPGTMLVNSTQGHVTTYIASAGNSFLWQSQDRRAEMKAVVSDVALFDLFHWGNATRRENNLNRSKKRMPLVCDNPWSL